MKMKKMNKVRNAISFDLEFWYDSEFVKEKPNEDMILEGLKTVLDILEKNNTKATFFVTGEVVKKYPEEIKNIQKRGHEIASHSYTHKMISKMSRDEFQNEVRKSAEIIKKTTGKIPKGFRAPSWSITEKESWFYEVLKENRFEYSSSLFPVNMGLYGSNKFPLAPFYTSVKGIKEIPVRPFVFWKLRIPFSGGVFFRLWPAKIIELFIKKLNNQGEGVILYLHPWEFCEELPKVKTNFIGKITTYYNTKNNQKKLERVLKKFKFYPFKNIL
jgi:polysaccharide deacetylase family protein (PEP-CTERM system associated)